jgi:uncharacterized membrane-anchored protein
MHDKIILDKVPPDLWNVALLGVSAASLFNTPTKTVTIFDKYKVKMTRNRDSLRVQVSEID